MSVYTRLTKEELEQLLTRFDIGKYVHIEGINEGITNSNFYLTTTSGKYILTIFEDPELNLNYAIELMGVLSKNHIPCPTPLETKDGECILNFQNKPLTIFTLLPGKTLSNKKPTRKMCIQIGEILGKIHLYSKKYNSYNEGLRESNWFQKTANKLEPYLDKKDNILISKEIQNQILCTNKDLPSGIIHSDLFRDNAMFIKENLTGVIDFYYACNGYYLYDIAIVVNDWCLNNDFSIDIEMQDALLKSYNQIRKIELNEKNIWQQVLRHAALRFWLSRLHDKFFPTDGEITHELDPDKFKKILLDRKNNTYEIKI
jgi:homoserine kinase type II